MLPRHLLVITLKAERRLNRRRARQLQLNLREGAAKIRYELVILLLKRRLKRGLIH